MISHAIISHFSFLSAGLFESSLREFYIYIYTLTYIHTHTHMHTYTCVIYGLTPLPPTLPVTDLMNY